jgi:hypothetical protein
MFPDLKCLYCGEAISPAPGGNRFCSPDHLARYTRDTKQRLVEAVTLVGLTTRSSRERLPKPPRFSFPAVVSLATGSLAPLVDTGFPGFRAPFQVRALRPIHYHLSVSIHKPRNPDIRIGIRVVPTGKTETRLNLFRTEPMAPAGRNSVILNFSALSSIPVLGVDGAEPADAEKDAPGTASDPPPPVIGKQLFFRPEITAQTVPVRNAPLKRSSPRGEGIFVPRVRVGVLLPRGSFAPKIEGGPRGKSRPTTIPINTSRARSIPRAG